VSMGGEISGWCVGAYGGVEIILVVCGWVSQGVE